VHFRDKVLPSALKMSSDKTLICKFWLKRRCEKGENCKYAHGEEEKVRACRAIQCQFFAVGSCRLGSECLYSHSDKCELRQNTNGSSPTPVPEFETTADEFTMSECNESGTVAQDRPTPGGGLSSPAITSSASSSEPAAAKAVIIVRQAPTRRFDKTMLCRYWLKNRCDRGDDCHYAHGEEERHRACREIACKSELAGSCLDPECPFAHSRKQCSDPGESCDDGSSAGEVDGVSSATTTWPLEETDDECPKTKGCYSRYKADLRDGKFDKTQLCKFWQKGRCQRHGTCKYAHGLEEQRAACAFIPCRRFQNGTCKQGVDCMFAHTPVPPTPSTTASISPQGSTCLKSQIRRRRWADETDSEEEIWTSSGVEGLKSGLEEADSPILPEKGFMLPPAMADEPLEA